MEQSNKENVMFESTESTKIKSFNSLIKEGLIQLLQIIITAIVSLFILKFLFYGFDFTNAVIMVLLTVLPFIFFGVFFRGGFFNKYQFNIRIRLYILLILIIFSLSFILFEFGLFYLYCDGFFMRFSDKIC